MPNDQDYILTCSGLTQRVPAPEGELTILDAIDLRLPRGGSLAVTGASGSGKTTLLGLLAGLDTATSGSIVLDGVELDTLDEEQRAALRRHRVGFVFQSFHLLDTLTALENVLLPLEITGASDARAKAAAALAEVGLKPRLHHYPGQLSGGEQQRVALARAFAGQPRLLFADEPTGNLDAVTGRRVADRLFELNRRHGTSLLLVTHDSDIAARCDQRIGLKAGRLLEAAA